MELGSDRVVSLYIKAGGAPQALPPLDYDETGAPWTDLENSASARAACGWSLAPEPPTHDPETERLAWLAGAWTIEAIPPAPAPRPRIAKYWLFERFTEAQERAFAGLEYQARNLTPAQLDNPANDELFQLQRFLRRLDALAVLELDATQTLAGFELLRLLGVFGDPEDPASTAAMQAILAPPTPTEAA